MARRSVSVSRKQDLRQLAFLIRKGLEENNLQSSELAKAVDLDRSHLSKVLSATRSLSQKHLMAVADFLGLSRQRLLLAAGYENADELNIETNNIALPDRRGKQRTLKFVTDPRFIDSALFMYMASVQPFRAIGIEIDCELIRADWNAIPEVVASQEYCVGFHTRQSISTHSGQHPYKVARWADLSRFEGYALLARPQICPTTIETDEQADNFLSKLADTLRDKENRKPVIVSMGADTLWQLQGVVKSLQQEKYDFIEYRDADFALRQFLERNIGDLYIGGLPQMFVAKERGCVPVLGSKQTPFLFAYNSLICPEAMIQHERALLFSILSLWYGMIEKLKSDPTFLSHVVESIDILLRDLGVQGHNHQERFFRKVLQPQDDEVYEVFANHPTSLQDDILERILKSKRRSPEDIAEYQKRLSPEIPTSNY